MMKTRKTAYSLLAGLVFAVFSVGSAVAVQSLAPADGTLPEGVISWNCPPTCG